MLVLFASHPLCWNRRFVANEGFLTQKTRGEKYNLFDFVRSRFIYWFRTYWLNL